MTPDRRSLLALALLASACSTPRPPSLDQRRRTLKELGFVETEEGWALNLASRVQFEFGSDRLRAEGIAVVHQLGLNLLELEVQRCRVEGHADEVGSDAFNQQLSERRAQAVARVLSQAGLPAAQIATRGHGKRKPIAENQTEAGRMQNRRVVVIVPSQG